MNSINVHTERFLERNRANTTTKYENHVFQRGFKLFNT
jgi:hypothetical protein